MEDNYKKAFENCPELEPVDVVEVPIKGYVDKDGKVHFFEEVTETVWVPKIDLG